MKIPAVSRARPDGSSESLNKAEKPDPSETPTDPAPASADDHIGATEDQVVDTSPPAGEAFKDEPKQG